MSEIIDKVAQAMCHNRKFDWDHCDKAYWRGAAKAAIAAMREPTDEMIKSGHLLDPLGCDVEESDIKYVYDRIWFGMINEALK